jgi:hypothetical protein
MPVDRIALLPSSIHQSSVKPFTARELDFGLNVSCPVSRMMEGVMTGKMDLWMASVAFGLASYVAMILNCLAHEELHLSDEKICKLAVAGALLIAVALAASVLRWGTGKIR